MKVKGIVLHSSPSKLINTVGIFNYLGIESKKRHFTFTIITFGDSSTSQELPGNASKTDQDRPGDDFLKEKGGPPPGRLFYEDAQDLSSCLNLAFFNVSPGLAFTLLIHRSTCWTERT